MRLKQEKKLQRNKKISKLYAQKFKLNKIGQIFNISKQRVHQILFGYSTKKNKQLKELYFFTHQINYCQICDKKENLHLHHIDNNIDNNLRENLVLLCEECHKYVHETKICSFCGFIKSKFISTSFGLICIDCNNSLKNSKIWTNNTSS